jgi:hypothetical protein
MILLFGKILSHRLACGLAVLLTKERKKTFRLAVWKC